MKFELARPGVQYGRDAEFGAEPLRIVAEGEGGLGRGAQEQRKHRPAMREREGSQGGREGGV